MTARSHRAEIWVARMKATIVLTTGVFLIGMVGSATADPLADAGAAYDKGDYATALQDLRPLAARGVAAAQDDLGLMYHNGQACGAGVSDISKLPVKPGYTSVEAKFPEDKKGPQAQEQ